MASLGLNHGMRTGGSYLMPEASSALNLNAKARKASNPGSGGVGLPGMITPVQVQPLAPLSEAPQAMPGEEGFDIGAIQAKLDAQAPSPSARAPAAAGQGGEGLSRFQKDPIGSIGLILASFGAGMNGQPNPMIALQAQEADQLAAQYRTAQLGLNVIEAATKQLAGRPPEQHEAIIADFDKRFSRALGGMSVRPMLEGISNGQIKNAEAKIKLARELGLISPKVLEYYGNDVAGLDKLLDTVISAKAGQKSPADIKAETVARAEGEKQVNPPKTVEELGAEEFAKAKNRTLGEAAAGGGPPSKAFEQENSLRDEFISQSQEFVTKQNNFKIVESAGKNPTHAGDISLVYGYMKMLDPNTGVLQGEQANISNAKAIPDYIRGEYNRLITGEGTLSENTRNQFIDKAREIYEQAVDYHRGLRDEYSRLAKQNKLDASNVIVDYLRKLPTMKTPEEARSKLPIMKTPEEAGSKLKSGARFLTLDGREMVVP